MADTTTSGPDAGPTSASPGDNTDPIAGNAPEGQAQGLSDEEILEQARECLRLAQEAESAIRLDALDDLKFLAGDQWPAEIRESRRRKQRPCLTINRLPQFVQQIANDQRQNRPAIKVHPVSDGADEDTAKVIQGLIRHIEYNSDAEVAYDTAFESAVKCGFGFFRIVTEFSDPKSFDQEILIKRIRNPFSVFLDPFSQEPDGSDANFALIIDDLSKDDYRRAYPGSELASRDTDLAAIGNNAPDWVGDKGLRVAEYFYKDYKSATIHLLSTGETVLDEDLPGRIQAAMQAGLQDFRIVDLRDTKIPVIRWCKINAVEILERGEWPGQFIPVIPVYGQEHFIDGKRILEGIIRNAKDPQRMYNYWASAETEAIALAPKAPFIGAEGQFEGHESEWKTANVENHAYLEYKQTDLDGRPAAPPQRQAIEPAVQAITQARAMSADDLKGTTGVYDAGVGAQSNEVSGVAIQKRTTQIQTANFHFVDNLTRSMKHAGRIMLDAIPYVYDAERTVRIVGEDGTQKLVKLNQEHQDESGETRIYDMNVGRYDVAMDVGPSFASKRQEAAAMMQEMTRAVPQLLSVAGDLMFRNLDVPGAQEIADRLKKTLPPALQDDGKQPQIPPQAQAQMAQMSQVIKGLTQNLNEATKVIETKKLELEHKERVQMLEAQLEREKLQAEIEMTMAKLGSQSSIELLKQEIGAIKHENALMNDRLKLLNMNAPIGAPNDFDPNQADGGNYAGVGHIGGSENLTGGEQSPGSPMEGN